jgi:hypothetical protein
MQEGITMELGQLYPVILALVLVGMILGVGILILDKFGGSSGISAAASLAINQTRDAIATFATWMGIIVVIVAAAIMINLVVSSFRGSDSNNR